MYNERNRGLRKTVLFGDMPSKNTHSGKPPDFNNVHSGYFRANCFSKSVPSFVHHILNVVLLCAKKQMIRIAALPIIAFVARKEIVFNFSKMEFPRYAMSLKLFLFVIKNSIPNFIHISKPLPTVAQFWNMGRNWPIFINLLPKSLLKRLYSLKISIVPSSNWCHCFARLTHTSFMFGLSRFRSSYFCDGDSIFYHNHPLDKYSLTPSLK